MPAFEEVRELAYKLFSQSVIDDPPRNRDDRRERAFKAFQQATHFCTVADAVATGAVVLDEPDEPDEPIDDELDEPIDPDSPIDPIDPLDALMDKLCHGDDDDEYWLDSDAN